MFKKFQEYATYCRQHQPKELQKLLDQIWNEILNTKVQCDSVIEEEAELCEISIKILELKKKYVIKCLSLINK
jgi:hypothetical protein